MPGSRVLARWLPVSMRGCALVMAVTALLIGCRGKAPLPAGDTYTVGGVVEKLPQADGPDRDIYIHHAPIPGFRDEHGRVVGMMSMTMPFPLASGVSLAGIRLGDPVEFTFTVRWKRPVGYELTRIQKLPAGTVVDFGSNPWRSDWPLLGSTSIAVGIPDEKHLLRRARCGTAGNEGRGTRLSEIIP